MEENVKANRLQNSQTHVYYASIYKRFKKMKTKKKNIVF